MGLINSRSLRFHKLPQDVVIMIILRLKPSKLAYEVIYNNRFQMRAYFARKRTEIHQLLFEDWKQHLLLVIHHSPTINVKIGQFEYYTQYGRLDVGITHCIEPNGLWMRKDVHGMFNFNILNKLYFKIYVAQRRFYIKGTVDTEYEPGYYVVYEIMDARMPEPQLIYFKVSRVV